MESTSTIPAYWSNQPAWFKENEWLITNQETLFVRRLGNTIYQINLDIGVKEPNQKPMAATKQCLSGDIASEGTKFQYNQTLVELQKLNDNDKKEAEKCMERFNSEFKEYLQFLTSN